MNKPIQIIYDIIKLSSQKLRIIEYEQIGEDMVFTVQSKGKRATCTNKDCKAKTCKRKDRIYHEGPRLKHLSLSDLRQIMIKPRRRRFRCESCGKSFLEMFPCESSVGRHTIAFEQYVTAAWGYMSGCEIGRQTKTSNSKIHSILKTIDPDILNKEGRRYMELAEEIWIGIDEHSFSGRDMVAVIVDIKEMVPLAILNNNQMQTIQAWFRSLPMEIKKKIKGVASDMNAGYIKRIEEVVGKTISVIDKYHLVQEANRMVDEVRALNGHLIRNNLVDIDEYLETGKIPKQVQEHIESKLGVGSIGKYKSKEAQKTLDEHSFTPEELTNSKEKQVVFKEITLSYYLNVKGGYRMLFMKREQNLSGIQRLRLRQILREFDYKGYLGESWMLKERFAQALDDKIYEEIVEIRKQALESEHYRIKQFGRTLKRWDVQLKNYCAFTGKHSCTNAGTEAFNGVCKTGKIVSRGFKHKENYRKKTGTRLVRNTREAIARIQNCDLISQ